MAQATVTRDAVPTKARKKGNFTPWAEELDRLNVRMQKDQEETRRALTQIRKTNAETQIILDRIQAS